MCTSCKLMQTSMDYKQCNLFAVFVCIFRIAERQRLSANDKQCGLFALFVCFTALQKGKDFLPMTTVQFICAVCLFYRIAERQRLSANDKQCNLFALFVCFTASQKGKDFLPMTNSAVYLRCLSILPLICAVCLWAPRRFPLLCKQRWVPQGNRMRSR